MKFPLGRVLITKGAIAFCQEHQIDEHALLIRHGNADWGEMCDEDKALNDNGLASGEDRLFSSYTTAHGKVWVITEWDRSVTTILLPEEY